MSWGDVVGRLSFSFLAQVNFFLRRPVEQSKWIPGVFLYVAERAAFLCFSSYVMGG